MADGRPPQYGEDLTIYRRRPRVATAGEAGCAWYLVMVEGNEPGRRVRLAETPLVIGRIEPADLVLADSEVSRRHCAVQIHPVLGLMVTDFEATNGTFVDGRAIHGSVVLPETALLQMGRHVFRCERLTLPEAAQVEAFADELKRARDYVGALLPPPIAEGPIKVDWVFLPSTHLGGDAFGYRWLDPQRFAFHLIDVSGHGPGAALHSAAIISMLRNRNLPASGFERPDTVVGRLNADFPMDQHAGMCFTVWYGVFDLASRRLEYCSAGHHPAFLAEPDGATLTALQTRNLLVGALADYRFRSAEVAIPPGSQLYLFSDGVFEVRGEDGSEGTLADFKGLLQGASGSAAASPEELLRSVRTRAAPGPFDDDFTLLRFEFA